MRIFTLDREMPFAGHPTLGSCHAWLAAGGTPKDPGRIIQECGVGLVTVRQHEAGLAFAAPTLKRSGPVEQAKRQELIEFLRVSPDEVVDMQWVDNDPGWVAVLLKSAEAVLSLTPAHHHATRLDLGVVGAYPPAGEAAWELRALFTDPRGVILEDPATGSLNASVAQWLLGAARATAPYVASQGPCLGRKGRVRVDQDGGGRIWIGTATRTLFSGETAF